MAKISKNLELEKLENMTKKHNIFEKTLSYS